MPTNSRRFKKGNTASKAHWFKPGHSGNPDGRPAGTSIREWWNYLLAENEGIPKYTVRDLWAIREAPDDDPKVSTAKRIAAAMIIDALKGGRRAIEVTALIFDRTEGRPAQTVNLSGNLGMDPSVEITQQTLERIRAAASNGQ